MSVEPGSFVREITSSIEPLSYNTFTQVTDKTSS
jgi:hypothetical protein